LCVRNTKARVVKINRFSYKLKTPSAFICREFIVQHAVLLNEQFVGPMTNILHDKCKTIWF